MKKVIVFFIAGILLSANSSCNNVQKNEKGIIQNDSIVEKMNKNTDGLQINMLRKFYTNYAKIWTGPTT